MAAGARRGSHVLALVGGALPEIYGEFWIPTPNWMRSGRAELWVLPVPVAACVVLPVFCNPPSFSPCVCEAGRVQRSGLGAEHRPAVAQTTPNPPCADRAGLGTGAVELTLHRAFGREGKGAGPDGGGSVW